MTFNLFTLLESFIQFFKQHSLYNPTLRYAVAVSGGIDSVVLSELCFRAGLPFVIVHCNFTLREEESERDEAFVRSLGEKYKVPVEVKRFDTKAFAEENKMSIQEAARKLRYDWFHELKDKGDCALTLLAHHANDNAETLLLNFFRGTGLHGLTAMPVYDRYVFRPLLSFTREQIANFARSENLAWVEDSSNLSSKYTRNYFRNELLPSIGKVFPEVTANLIDNIDRFKKAERLYNQLVSDLKRKIIIPAPSGAVKVPVLLLKKHLDTSLIYEIIKDYGFTEKQVPEVSKLLDSESGKYVAGDSYRVIKHRNHLIIAPYTKEAEICILDNGDKKVVYDHQSMLQIEQQLRERFQIKTAQDIAQLDLKQIEWPMILRKWKQGDYFYPLGMKKKKKLARFFIDQKIPRNEKENIWVLESAKRIVWVVGHRIDDRFKITPATKEVLVITASSL